MKKSKYASPRVGNTPRKEVPERYARYFGITRKDLPVVIGMDLATTEGVDTTVIFDNHVGMDLHRAFIDPAWVQETREMFRAPNPANELAVIQEDGHNRRTAFQILYGGRRAGLVNNYAIQGARVSLAAGVDFSALEERVAAFDIRREEAMNRAARDFAARVDRELLAMIPAQTERVHGFRSPDEELPIAAPPQLGVSMEAAAAAMSRFGEAFRGYPAWQRESAFVTLHNYADWGTPTPLSPHKQKKKKKGPKHLKAGEVVQPRKIERTLAGVKVFQVRARNGQIKRIAQSIKQIEIDFKRRRR